MRDGVRADWSEERARAGAAGLRLRKRRRVVVRAALGTVAALAVLAGGGWALLVRTVHVTPRDPIAARSAAPEPSTTLRFDDGSAASPSGSGSRLRVTAASPGHVVVEVVAGAGRFDVTHDPARVFRVEGGVVRVETFGAKFAFWQDEEKARVEVLEGSVRVLWAAEQRELTSGQSGLYPPDAPPVASVVEPTRRRPQRARAALPSWRDLAEEGDYDRAYEALTRSDAPTVSDQPEELLLAADVKRFSHHSAEAVAPLEQIVHDHRADPRASLAAFTLGRVLLEELGRPREAAEAFADVEALAPHGPMAEDALAREVEAWSRAGEAARAHQLAEQYSQRYPNGRKLRSVRRFGELE